MPSLPPPPVALLEQRPIEAARRLCWHAALGGWQRPEPRPGPASPGQRWRSEPYLGGGSHARVQGGEGHLAQCTPSMGSRAVRVAFVLCDCLGLGEDCQSTRRRGPADLGPGGGAGPDEGHPGPAAEVHPGTGAVQRRPGEGQEVPWVEGVRFGALEPPQGPSGATGPSFLQAGLP